MYKHFCENHIEQYFFFYTTDIQIIMCLYCVLIWFEMSWNSYQIYTANVAQRCFWSGIYTV